MRALDATRQFLRQSVLARIGFAAALVLVLAALLAPWIAPADPAAQNLPARLQAPSHAHWMGTDELGRDTLSRTLYGARISLLVAVSVVCGCGFTGLIVGMLAGYAGGWFDRFVNLLLINAFLSFPGDSAGDRLRGISRAGHRQSDSGAGHHRLGRLCATGPCAGAESEGVGICARRAIPWRSAPAHPGEASAPQHSAAGPDSGHHWHGRSDPRRIHVEFSGTWGAGAGTQLGRDAE